MSEEKDIYTDEGREELIDDGEIEPWEDAFMRGAEGEGEEGVCKNCDKVLTDKDKIIEKEYDGRIVRFCSSACADEYKEKDNDEE